MRLDASFVNRLYEQFLEQHPAPKDATLSLMRDAGEVRHGFHAEFFDDGTLAHFGYYRHGNRDGRWSLFLEPRAFRGRAQKVFTENYPDDVDPGAHLTRDDASNATAYRSWVEGWINRILIEYGDPGKRCSFCARRRQPGQHLFAGPEVYICGDCVRTCVNIMERSPAAEPEGGA